MRVSVDRNRCVGHAQCYAVAQSVYDLDDEGYCEITVSDVAPENEDAARAGADACPELAITIIE